jgi:uroporphyrin-III C-methyltransferase
MQPAKSEAAMESERQQPEAGSPTPARESGTSGRVYLVGAGPGDPELLTLKGLRYLRTADVVVYDRLVNSSLLAEVSELAELIFVGKQVGYCAMRQEQINALLVEQATLGKTVVRLKGGDPFVFGRGGEEALALAEAGIPFEIVPGVSSAFAVPAYAGIPVTHRGQSTAVTIVTGHEGSASSASQVNWESLAQFNGTIVVLMGLATLSQISQRLLSGGMSPEMPVAVIEQGTVSQQRLQGTLLDIAERVVTTGVTSPAVIVIGSVVNLSATLSWFAGASSEAPSSHITSHHN